MDKEKTLDTIALVLVIISGLNLGLVGLFTKKYDLVQLTFGSMPILVDIIYTLVGASAVHLLLVFNKIGKR